jgi:hypothetical protein
MSEADDKERELIAYAIPGRVPMPIVPAPIGRAWIDATSERFARRCLPLLMANQAGWHLLNSHSFRVEWDGGDGTASLRIVYLNGDPPYPATSTFGYGIVTFAVPYLFRTPPGYNLLARGPANCVKDGVTALEGLVETDWAVATFTMNWKLTRAGQVIEFTRDEPICQVVPQRRGEVEDFHPRIEDMATDPKLESDHRHWAESRRLFLIHRRMAPRRLGPTPWQRHYLRGTSPSGTSAPVHQNRMRPRPFRSARELPWQPNRKKEESAT